MTIKCISWQQALPVRHQVLWPTKAPDFCKIEGDELAYYYGYFVKNQLVAVASIYLDGNKARLRKFATLSAYQSQGIGTKLISHILKELNSSDVTTFWCDARASAVGFYQRLGFIVEGELFYKEQVSYYKMSRRI